MWTIVVHGEVSSKKLVFGRDLKVYLDIFHAMKRVSEKIPKRHRLRQECMDEWRLVFRDPSDRGKERHMATPSAEVLESSLDQFKNRWKDAQCNGQPVLSMPALKEIEHIRVHMKKGCLSGIKPGRGTNRNEGLHKDLNGIMSSARYGVELAYALVFLNTMKRWHQKLRKDQSILWSFTKTKMFNAYPHHRKSLVSILKDVMSWEWNVPLQNLQVNFYPCWTSRLVRTCNYTHE